MDKLVAMWSSLGITFAGSFDREYLPEEAMIATIQHGLFPKDRKMFSIMLLWLTKYHRYIHVERLKNMLGDLNMVELSLVAGLAVKMLNQKDHRWKSIIRYVDKKRGTVPISFATVCDHPLFIKRHGLDVEFSQYGISVAVLQPAAENKILSENKVLQLNRWIKNRCLFGVNFRADMATLMQLKLAPTAYQSAKVLRCSVNTAYSHWSDLQKVGAAIL
jgi:hypothetical protein